MFAAEIIERDWLLGAPQRAVPTVALCVCHGCRGIVVAKNLCEKHYRRMKRHGSVDSTRAADWGQREQHALYKFWCGFRRNYGSDCGNWHDDFWCFVKDVGERPSEKHYLVRLDPSKPYGTGNAAWSLAKNENRRARGSVDPFYESKKGLGRQHGITLEQYERLFDAQNGLCAICQRPEVRVDMKTNRPYRLAVDHCHNGNVIRGLLCSPCNLSLGALDDSPALLRRAAEYLENPPSSIPHSGKHKRRLRDRVPSPHSIKEP